LTATIINEYYYYYYYFYTPGSIGPGAKNKEKSRATLKRWIVTDSRWKMNDSSRLSPDTSLILQQRSLKKWYAESFTEPKVSMAIGRKVYAEGMLVYFWHFLAAASSATSAHPRAAAATKSARVHTTVTSHTNNFPERHRICVIPSWSLPSQHVRPTGSFAAGTPADTRVELGNV